MKKVFYLLLSLFILLFFSCTAPVKKSTVWEKKVIEFPKDMSPHYGYKIEWWYQTGYLLTEASRGIPRFAYEFTIFKYYNPESKNWPKFFGIPSKEIWLVHFVLHDFKNDKRIFTEETGFPWLLVFGEPVNVKEKGLNISGNWNKLKFVLIGNEKEMNLVVEDKVNDLKLNLKLISEKGPVLHNNGIVDMGDAGKSYYYSLTRLKSLGDLKVKEKEMKVYGYTWFDQQWGNFMTKPWDWFSIRLDSKEEIMLFYFPHSSVKYGTYVNEKGEAIFIHNFDISLKDHLTVKKEIPIPNPGIIKINEEGLKAEFVIKTLSKNQINISRYSPTYWEGLCTVEGNINGNRVEGYAFFEGWR